MRTSKLSSVYLWCAALLVWIVTADLPLQAQSGAARPRSTTRTRVRRERPLSAEELRRLTPAERADYFLKRRQEIQRRQQAEELKKRRRDAIAGVAALRRELASTSPKERPRLLYRIGGLYLHAGIPRSAEKFFEELVEEHAQTPYAELAEIHQFDIALYMDHDLTAAVLLLTKRPREAPDEPSSDQSDAPASGSSATPAAIDPPRAVSVPPLIPPLGALQTTDSVAEAAAVRPNRIVRKALLTYLEGHDPQIEVSSIPGRSSIWTILINWDRWKDRISRFPSALDEQSNALPWIRLADLHMAAQDYPRALDILTTALNPRSARPTGLQRSYVYFRRGFCIFRLESKGQSSKFDLDDAVTDYERAQKLAPEARWAPEALFLAANIRFSVQRDAEAAQSILKQLVAKYPESPFGERAAFHFAALYQYRGQIEEAKKAFAEFRENYPESERLKLLDDEGLSRALSRRINGR